MRPALWVRASFCVSLFTCIVAIGAVGVLTSRVVALADRLEIGRVGTAADLAVLRTSIDHLADEIRFSAPADLGHKHTAVRSFIIQSQLAQVNDPIVFIGDSITESAFLPATICGHPVVNAGLGGATTRTYLQFANTVLSTLRARLIVVALGTNDSQIAARKAGPFSESYDMLTGFLKTHAAALVLVGIPPLEMTQTLAREYFDKAASDENDRAINTIAARDSISFADVRSAMNSDHLTVDGVHLSPDGYQGWMTAVSAAVSKTLNCRAASN
jgi:lysophospholipase L1-like esterase